MTAEESVPSLEEPLASGVKKVPEDESGGDETTGKEEHDYHQPQYSSHDDAVGDTNGVTGNEQRYPAEGSDHQQQEEQQHSKPRSRSRSPRGSRSRSPRGGSGGRAGAAARLYVSGLGSRNEVTESMVRELFEQFGKVVAVAPKGAYAFVEFDTIEESDNALKKLHNSIQWGGKRIIVEYSNDPRSSGSRSSHTADRCYHCGKHGHWARECPDRGGKDVCFKCNRPGHIARDCPDSRYGGSSRRGGPSYASGPPSYGGGYGRGRGPPPSSYGAPYPQYADPYASRYGDRRMDSGYRSGGGYYDAAAAPRGRSRSPPYARGYGAPPASYGSSYGSGYDDYSRGAPPAASFYGSSGYDDRSHADYSGGYDTSRGVPPSDYYGAAPHQPPRY